MEMKAKRATRVRWVSGGEILNVVAPDFTSMRSNVLTVHMWVRVSESVSRDATNAHTYYIHHLHLKKETSFFSSFLELHYSSKTETPINIDATDFKMEYVVRYISM